jgi:predicted RNase H-like HicB family nuclease
MPVNYTAVIKKEGAWWIGWIEEIAGVNCQERTKASLITSLREALAEAIDINRREARRAARVNYTEAVIRL